MIRAFQFTFTQCDSAHCCFRSLTKPYYGTLFTFVKYCIAIGMLLGLMPADGLHAGDRFSFRYRTGDRYRILSTVQQDIYINDSYSHSAELLNRIAVEVEEGQAERGRLRGLFQLSEEAQLSDEIFRLSTEYESEYWRDRLGRYDIDPRYFAPVVRDVPIFPDRELEVNDTWTAIGTETHDFRANFGIEQPYSFEVPVVYIYLGQRRYKGRSYPAFAIRYNIFHVVRNRPNVPFYPRIISGFSDQTLYWDAAAGRPHAYEEEYLIILSLNDGNNWRFQGSASAEVIASANFDREQITRDIERSLQESGVADAQVVPDERGVTITLENVQFQPDSAYLTPAERRKLFHIAEILMRYPSRDVLISGHTALAGTAAGRQQLSEERASAVARFLIERGARTRTQILIQGFGARRPLADNSFEAGRRRNRRVEITILEN